MKWTFIDSGSQFGHLLMERDDELLQGLSDASDPLLHFYEWSGINATYGYFLDPYDFLNRETVEQQGLLLARRPTGGGLLFHIHDFAFSVLVPASSPHYSVNTLENYAFINNRVIEVLKGIYGDKFNLYCSERAGEKTPDSFCMAKPTQYDIMLEGKKIGGAAQRRTKKGFLHQASLFLAPPPYALIQGLLKRESIAMIDKMKAQSRFLLTVDWTQNELDRLRSEIKDRLKRVFEFVA